jgi:hypothetical protein
VIFEERNAEGSAEKRMNVDQLGRTSTSTLEAGAKERRVPTEREMLEELFELLEDYAPTWYTEEHHNRALAALLGRDR